MSELTTEGERLVKAWMDSTERLKHARSEVNSAECAETNAEAPLARWLLPDDAKDGERFCVWHGSKLLCAEKKGNDVKVNVRQSRRAA